MIRGLWHCCRSIALLLITTLAVAGCSVMGGTAASTATPTVQAGKSALTAIQPSVQRLRGNGETDLQPGDRLEVQPRDQIKLSDTGRAFLDFPQQAEVELVRSSDVQVNDLQVDAAGVGHVTLKQALGHSFTR